MKEHTFTNETVNVAAPKNATDKTIVDFLSSIEKEWLKQFRKGWIHAQLRCVMGEPYIRIVCGIQAKEKHFNGILENDPAYQNVNIMLGDYKGGSIDNLILETEGRCTSILTKPDNKHHVYGSVKFGYRKTKGTPDKILKHFAKYFAKCRSVVDELKENDKLAHDID